MNFTAILGFILFISIGSLVLWFVIRHKGVNGKLSLGWAYLGIFGIAMVLLPIVSLLTDDGGLCGEKTEVLSSNEDGTYFIDWYAQDCGATTAFSSKLILRSFDGDQNTILTGLGEPKISADWATSSVEVVVQGIRDYEVFDVEIDDFNVKTQVFSGAEKLLKPIQTISHPSKSLKYVLYSDMPCGGFGDFGWAVYEVNTDNDLQVACNANDPQLGQKGPGIKLVLSNYSEDGSDTRKPNIELAEDRYLIFSRGGYRYGLYDIESGETLVNEWSPWNKYRENTGESMQLEVNQYLE